MKSGREKSDDDVVPEDGRKSVSIADTPRGGKVVTVKKEMRQLSLPFGSAEIPKGSDTEIAFGEPKSRSRSQPLPNRTRGNSSSVAEGVLELIADKRNLQEALRQVVANRGAAGPDGQAVDDVRENSVEVVERLHRGLIEKWYRPGDIRRVWIPKHGGGLRGLGIPNVVDRIVQQAILRVLSPMYEATFDPSSHGFRPGRSCHTALAEAKEHIKAGYIVVVDLDIEKFFDRVHHQRLLSRLIDKVKDQRVIHLISKMLKAKIVLPDGVKVSSDEGTPQGGPLSPLLSNIVLDELDQMLRQRGHRFVRYADDVNIYVRTLRAGERVFRSVAEFLIRRLRLTVNAEKCAVGSPNSRHFLGFRLTPRSRGGIEVGMSERTKLRLRDRIVELTPRVWGQSVRSCIAKINAFIRGWSEYFGVADRIRGIKASDSHLRRRLRALILQQWRSRGTATHRLIRLGVPKPLAIKTMHWGRGNWRLSHSHAVQWGLGNSFFEELGLLSLSTKCEERKRRPLPGSR